jgi:RimJ/RimL family protein N-acetyltransferase
VLHGLGLGPAMLAAGEQAVREAGDARGRFVATVLGDNPASKRMFAALGYADSGGTWTKPIAAAAGVHA